MKIKRNLYINDQEQFLKNPDSDCYSLSSGRWMDDRWTFLGEVEFEVADPDSAAIVKAATDTFDATILELEGQVEMLKTRKAELLALPAPEAS